MSVSFKAVPTRSGYHGVIEISTSKGRRYFSNDNPLEFSEYEYEEEMEISGAVFVNLDVSPSDFSDGATFFFKYLNLSIEWSDRMVSPVKIDTIFQETLLNKILEKMSEGEEPLTGEIELIHGDDLRLTKTKILAAESIRGIKDAKIYTSFNKFRDWMEAVFGYVYSIEGRRIKFSHRTSYFQDVQVKEVDSYNDFRQSVNSFLVYSEVKAGYDKEDYDSVNGRDEYHFGITFTTGLKLTNNALNLISPYRADCYGIEFLVQKRGEDTTDNSSDKDIFFVGAHTGSINGEIGYVLIREDKLTGVISPETQFNSMFSPRRCIEANKEMIGACTDLLTFASSEGNSDISINGVREDADIVFNKDGRLFTVGEIEFKTSEYKAPENIEGYVKIVHKGEEYRGWIQKVDVNQGKTEASKFVLIEKGK